MSRSSKTLKDAIMANGVKPVGVYSKIKPCHCGSSSCSGVKYIGGYFKGDFMPELNFLDDTARKIDVLLAQPHFQGDQQLHGLKEFFNDVKQHKVNVTNNRDAKVLDDYYDKAKNALKRRYNEAVLALQSNNAGVYALLNNTTFAEAIANVAPRNIDFAGVSVCVGGSVSLVTAYLGVMALFVIAVTQSKQPIQATLLGSINSLIQSSPLTASMAIATTLLAVGITAGLIALFVSKYKHAKALASLKTQLSTHIPVATPVAMHDGVGIRDASLVNHNLLTAEYASSSSQSTRANMHNSTPLLTAEAVSPTNNPENLPQA